jgi:putative thioredoxin
VLSPTLERLANEARGKFLLAKIDVDRSPRHAQAFGIRGIPTVMAFRDGQIVAEFSGALPEDAVREFLRKILPSAADDLVAQAERVKSEKPAAAEALYRQALAADAGHAGAAIGLAEVVVARGEIVEAASLLKRITATGPLLDRVAQLQSEIALLEQKPKISESELRKRIDETPDPAPLLVELGRLLAAEKRFPEALQVLLQAAGRNRALAEGEVKDLMVSIFHAVGVRSPLADEYRTKLSRLLY